VSPRKVEDLFVLLLKRFSKRSFRCLACDNHLPITSAMTSSVTDETCIRTVSIKMDYIYNNNKQTKNYVFYMDDS